MSRDGPYGRMQLVGLMRQLQVGTAQCRVAMDNAGPLRSIRRIQKRLKQLEKWKVVADSYPSSVPECTEPPTQSQLPRTQRKRDPEIP